MERAGPLASVVVPAFNECAALPRTLERLLRQAGDCEVIVVDGGSTDDTRSFAWRQKRRTLPGRG